VTEGFYVSRDVSNQKLLVEYPCAMIYAALTNDGNAGSGDNLKVTSPAYSIEERGYLWG
jgi:hypothetical protein